MAASLYLIRERTLQDIADAIREKGGPEEAIAVADYAEENKLRFEPMFALSGGNGSRPMRHRRAESRFVVILHKRQRKT